MTITPPATHNITATTATPLIQVGASNIVPVIIASTTGAQGPVGTNDPNATIDGGIIF
jgi:hypothetical protein